MRRCADDGHGAAQVVDTTAPVFTVPAPVVVAEAGSTYVAPAVTAADRVDGAIAAAAIQVSFSPPLDMRRVGDTTITFSARDAASNTGTATVTLRIVDTTAPVLVLNGAAAVEHRIDTPYTDAGAFATDNADSTATLQARIAMVNGVNVAAEGQYTVTFNVRDTSNNAATQLVRRVTIVVREDDGWLRWLSV